MRGPVTRESAAAVLSDLLTELRDSGADVGAELADVLDPLGLLVSSHEALNLRIQALASEAGRLAYIARIDAAKVAHPWMESLAARIWPGRWRWTAHQSAGTWRVRIDTFIGGHRMYLVPDSHHFPPPPIRGTDESMEEWRDRPRERVIEPSIYAHEVTVYGPAEDLERRYRAALQMELATYPARSRARGARLLRALIGVAG